MYAPRYAGVDVLGWRPTMRIKFLVWILAVFCLSASVMGALTDGLIQYYSAIGGTLTLETGQVLTKSGSPTNTTGFFNQAYNFTAIDQNLKNTSGSYTSTNQTISVWVKKEGVGGWKNTGYGSNFIGSNGWANGDWGILETTTTDSYLGIRVNSPTSQCDALTAIKMNNQQWYHVVGVIDGTNGNATIDRKSVV